MKQYDKDELKMKPLLEEIERNGAPYADSPGEVYFANLRVNIMDRVSALEEKRRTSFLDKVLEFFTPVRTAIAGTAAAAVIGGIFFFNPFNAGNQVMRPSTGNQQVAAVEPVQSIDNDTTHTLPAVKESPVKEAPVNSPSKTPVEVKEKTGKEVARKPIFAEKNTVPSTPESRPEKVLDNEQKTSSGEIVSNSELAALDGADASDVSEIASVSAGFEEQVVLEDLSSADLEMLYDELSK